jgi:hypothetical protein
LSLISFSLPQSHLHNHTAPCLPDIIRTNRSATNFPKRCPATSLIGL